MLLMDKKIDDQIVSKSNEITHRVIWIVGFTIVFGILISILYFATFHNYGLSDKQEDWGNFGAYIGGVLGPIIALGSLFGLALLIDLQRKTVEATREEMAASNQHFANQNFSAAVFELIKIISVVRQTVKWNPTNHYNNDTAKYDVNGEVAINGAFKNSLWLLVNKDNWSEAHCKAVLDSTYREFKQAHQAFGSYWGLVKESLDEIHFRGIDVSTEVMRHGERLFLTGLSVPELYVFYLLHCLNRQWTRLDLLELSGVLERTEDFIVERLRSCRAYAINHDCKYSVNPADIEKIEATGTGLDPLNKRPET